ncbi:MAG: polysaccharide biosynthesis protein [Bacillota bacterium]|nr:polysaccharide biosynthesis protein [Bacillota bacterium]
MKPVHQSKDLFKGAFILMAAALITKILSAVYRIPFQNIVGDIGFYIYQQVYPFYGIAIVLATTGFPVVISKLYAEHHEKGDSEKARQLLFISYVFLQLFGLICFLFLYIGSYQIALWMGDTKLVILLKVVSVVFLTFPVVSTLRGYFQGSGEMLPTALSQIVEQLIRVATIIFLAYLFTKKGYSLYLIGGGAMFGSITGSIVSAILLFMFLWFRKEWKMVTFDPLRLGGMFSGASWIFKALALQGLAICISGMMMIFIQLADSMNLYSLLLSGGLEKETAKGLKGIFDRGQPLIQLGMVVSSSMSLSLVPLITSERLKESSDFLSDKVRLALQISIVVGAGATAGLWSIVEPTNKMLFETADGSSVLGVLSLVILLSSIISTITAILQGLGKLVFPALIILTGFPVKYALNMALVPPYGTMGAAIATIITLSLVCIILTIQLSKALPFHLLTKRFAMAITAASLAMVLTLKLFMYATGGIYQYIGSERIAAAAQSLGAVMVGGVIFLFIILRSAVFREEELALFPFGSKLILFLPKEEGRKNVEKN